MTAQSVIYEVNLAVDVDVVERFDEWLHSHTQEMLAIPGFISASTSVPDVEDEFIKHRCVQFRLSDQAALDNYLANYAEHMRGKGEALFAGQFTATRRVLSIAEAASANQAECANCGAELSGRFCSVCGQREEPRVPTFGALLSEFTNEAFGVESRLWRSFGVLFFRPGRLTSVYLAGQRQKYMSPVRLYLLFSILTFAIFATLNSFDVLEINPKEAVEITEPASDGQDDESGNAETQVENGENDSEDKKDFEDLTFNSGFLSDEADAEISNRIRESFRSIKKDVEAGNQQAVISKFFEPLPTTLLLFLPVVALFFKILFLGSGRYYVEHLIYVVHNHAFLFAAIVFTALSTQLGKAWPIYDPIVAIGIIVGFFGFSYSSLRTYLHEKWSTSPFKTVLLIIIWLPLLILLVRLASNEGTSVLSDLLWAVYVPYYLYRSMRVVYARSRWATLITMFLIANIYFFLLVIMLIGSAAFVGFTYTA